MKQMTVMELRDRLQSGEPVVVVDIREADAFADWHIPGAVNVPVIHAMRANDPQPLAARADALPKDRPVVLVCNVGVSSARAQAMLEPLGFDVINLAGGMRAWSAVHTEARFAPKTADAVAIQIRRNGKGCLSYLIGHAGEAMVVDPAVDADVYADIARRQGLRITRVVETHVHADHVSRARALAERLAAALCLPANDRVSFEHEAIADGESWCIGDIDVRAIATPGHTGESTCYLVDEDVLLTGDTVFVDSVGRPDLEKGDAGAVDGARDLYASLHERILALPPDIRIYPAHTSADIGFDGTPISATIGEARQRVEHLLALDEDAFIREIVARIGAKPPSHAVVIRINEGKLDLGDGSPLDIEAGPNRCAVAAGR